MSNFTSSELIDTRELFTSEDKSIRVWAEMGADVDADPADADCYSEADVAAYLNDLWCYVGIIVHVELNGAEIGEGALWGIEHGTMGPNDDGTDNDVDAWEWSPAEILGVNNEGIVSVMGGQPLNSVVEEAVINATDWLARVGASPKEWRALEVWADPNAVAQTSGLEADWTLCNELGHFDETVTIAGEAVRIPFRCTDERGHKGDHNQ